MLFTQLVKCQLSEVVTHLVVVRFQKISIPSLWMVIGDSERVGVSRSKIFEGKYGANLEFPEGWEGSK